MGIAIIDELSSRLHRAAIAGTTLLKEDFRLKRTVEQLEKAAAANPVFKKMYEQGTALIAGTAEHPQEELLDLISLVDAVQITQAGAIVGGEAVLLEPQPESFAAAEGGTEIKQFKYSELMPVFQALTTKGSGRYEIIETAFRENSGVLRDVRLRNVLVGGLGDSYSEMAELVEKIILSLGKEIIPMLKKDFNFEGKQEMIRRLEVIQQIAGKEENDFYLMVVEQGKGLLRQKAIYALGLDADNLPKLLELADIEKGNSKKTVLCTLARIEDPRAEEYFEKYLKKHEEALSQFLIFNDSETISDIAAERMEQLLHMLESGKKSLTANEMKVVQITGAGMLNKTSPKMLDMIQKLAALMKNLASLRNEQNKSFSFYNVGNIYNAAENCAQGFVGQLMKTAIITENRRFHELMFELLEQYGLPFLPPALLAVLRFQPEQTYAMIEPYLSESKNDCKEMLKTTFTYLYYEQEDHSYYLKCKVPECNGINTYDVTEVRKKINLKIDLRLVKLLIETGQGYSYMMDQILDEQNEEQLALYREYYLQKARTGQNYQYLYNLQRYGNTDWKGLLCAYIKNLEIGYHQNVLNFYKELSLPPEEKLEELEMALKLVKNGAVKKIKIISADQLAEEISDYINLLRTYIERNEMQ